ncbi:putative oxidoreductase [Xylogone sp. PMI_703]|nr:putative oxidoreductase [Xylogone sp. PMI_703]
MPTPDEFIAAVAERRTIYPLTNESTISNKRLEEIVQKVILATPSAFHTQSARIIILYGAQHKKLWDIVKKALASHVSGDQAIETMAKIDSFQAGYASILFFEDPSAYEQLMSYKSYVDKFEGWRDQSTGMHQILLWTALDMEGLGMHVQHYNPLIDEDVKKTWSIPQEWKLTAQMVVGKPSGDRPPPKDKKPVEGRYRVIL